MKTILILCAAVLTTACGYAQQQTAAGQAEIDHRVQRLDHIARVNSEAMDRLQTRESQKEMNQRLSRLARAGGSQAKGASAEPMDPLAAVILRVKAVSYDKDGDGRLDEAEQAAWAARVRLQVEKTRWVRTEFDRDADGGLSDEEWAGFHAAIIAPLFRPE